MRHRRKLRIEQIEIGDGFGEHVGFGEPGELVLGRHPRHRDGALRQGVEIAREIVGRNHRLAAAHEGAQPEIVAFGAFGSFHRSVADLDRLRHAALRDRIGGIGPGAARGSHEPFRKRGQRGLVQQGIHRHSSI